MAPLVGPFLAAGLFPSPSHGMPLLVDRQCQRAESTEASYQVDNYYRLLVAGGKTYWLSLARYIDGSGIFCLSGGDFQDPRRLASSELQDQFISEINQKGQPNIFEVTVAHGNGLKVPMTMYRLDLGNPGKPVLSKIKEWVETR
ncbi:MAG: hypothetical protein VKO39_06255 [Cyanobacteriota bacterium]|nr:hypothetical protein [Cyanobacteriota bacterium]